MDEGSARVFVLELFPLWVLQTWCTLGLLCWLMKKNKRSLGLVSLMKVVYVAVVMATGTGFRVRLETADWDLRGCWPGPFLALGDLI